MTVLQTETESYTLDAAQEILRLAGAARRRMDFFTREDLIRAAAEMDMPERAVLEAERLIRERQSEEDDRAEYRRAKLLETGKYTAIAVPVLVLAIGFHGYSFMGQMFGAVKGMFKGVTALFFAKSTKHELEFQSWRNQRLYQARYFGLKKPGDLVRFYFKERESATAAELMAWLVDENGVTPSEAKTAILEFKQRNLEKVHDLSALTNVLDY